MLQRSLQVSNSQVRGVGGLTKNVYEAYGIGYVGGSGEKFLITGLNAYSHEQGI